MKTLDALRQEFIAAQVFYRSRPDNLFTTERKEVEVNRHKALHQLQFTTLRALRARQRRERRTP